MSFSSPRIITRMHVPFFLLLNVSTGFTRKGRASFLTTCYVSFNRVCVRKANCTAVLELAGSLL